MIVSRGLGRYDRSHTKWLVWLGENMSLAFLLAQAPPAQGGGSGAYWWPIAIGVLIFCALFFFIGLIVFAAYGQIWFRAYMSSADVQLISLIGMGFRQVDTRT